MHGWQQFYHRFHFDLCTFLPVSEADLSRDMHQQLLGTMGNYCRQMRWRQTLQFRRLDFVDHFFCSPLNWIGKFFMFQKKSKPKIFRQTNPHLFIIFGGCRDLWWSWRMWSFQLMACSSGFRGDKPCDSSRILIDWICPPPTQDAGSLPRNTSPPG